MEIPRQLKREEYRFCLINFKDKKPFETSWQNNGYKFNDTKFLEWTKDNNYGVIGGYGNLRIIDIDNPQTAEVLFPILDTFTVKTGGGGMHFYIESDYDKNHVFIDKQGEFRAQNYQVVGPNSVHPNGNVYSVSNDKEIKFIDKDELIKILSSLINNTEITEEQVNVNIDFLNKNVLSKLNNFICSLITQTRTKEDLQVLGFPSRSERDQKVITNLLLNGFGPYIKSIFDNYPVGDKYREHSSPKKYLEHSVKLSRKYSGVENDFIINLEKEIQEINDRILKNKVNKYLLEISKIEDWLQRLRLINIIAQKVLISKKDLIKKLEELNSNGSERKLDSVCELLKTEYKELDYLTTPLIPKNTLILVGGKSNSHKSMFVLSTLIHMKLGLTFLDTFSNEKRPDLKILYYDLENGPRVMQERLKYLTNPLEIDPSSLDNFTVMYDFDRQNIDREYTLSYKYDIVILDSYRRFLKGAENDSEITNEFYNKYLKPLREAGKTVIIIHHLKKAKLEDLEDADLIDMFRGSSDIVAQPDLAYGLFKGDETISTDGKLSFPLAVLKIKNRLGLPIKDFGFRVTKDDKLKSTFYEFKGFNMSRSPKDRIKDYIVEVIKKAGKIKREDIIKIVKEEYSLSERTIMRMLEELCREKIIFKPEHGTYSLT